MDEEVVAVAVEIKVLLRTVVALVLVVAFGHAKAVQLEALLCFIAEVAVQGVEDDRFPKQLASGNPWVGLGAAGPVGLTTVASSSGSLQSMSNTPAMSTK